MSIRLVLADDHPIVLHGLQQLFERHADFDVVSCCETGNAALDAVRQQRPDVLVLDLKMPGCTGLDVLRAIHAEHLACRSVLLTAAVRDDEVVQAVRLGARAVVLKDSQPDALVGCVRRVHAGEQWIEPEILERALRHAGTTGTATGASLTPREGEIVRMVAHGHRNRVIAERLGISEGTVKVHLHNIYEKLGVNGRLELVLAAQANDLI
jgi:DNA-binding NarL/FixJ family response regulator